MSIKTICAIAAVIVLAAAAWLYRDSKIVHDAAGGVSDFGKSIVPDNSYTTAKTGADKKAGPAGGPQGAHALRKCVADGRTVYTDEKCPPGSREAPISEGNVTVIPGQAAGTPAKGGEKAK